LTAWTSEQERCLSAVGEWLKNKDRPVFKLSGYAGTGKTTLAKHLAATVNGKVIFAAYTGKAASVMRRKGCTDATTLHRTLYVPKSKSRARLQELEQKLIETEEDDPSRESLVKEIKKERENVARPAFELKEELEARYASLIVIDECSMVDGKIGSDLIALGVPILALGDPGQLGPVRGQSFFDNENPDFMLEEIHRQAADSPIIKLATAVRLGKELELGEYGTSAVIAQGSIGDRLTETVQILCGFNNTVKATNNYMRRKYGRKSELPEVGDKMVCLKNNHDLGVLNGTIWHVVEPVVEFEDDSVVSVLKSEDDGTVVSAECYRPAFNNPKETMPPQGLNSFCYGYSLTVHKSQGSQWPQVIVLDESKGMAGFCEPAKFLYTAITRAVDRVTIVKNYRLGV
jgi:exodeoxyribonuclease-5